jgi:polyhydroxyalkanoate synthesis repressor PhaR
MIKRYPNRKLYDTEAKRYITLDGIAELIRDGQEVMIVDHTTEEDLTAVTLTQIIFEQEKKAGGFLPKSVLTGLVRTGGDTLNTLRRGLSVPLDLVKQVDSEIEHRLQELISKGELAKEEGLRLRDKLLSFSGQETDPSDREEEELQTLLSKHDVPTRVEVDRLKQQIEMLTQQLEGLVAPANRAESSAESAERDDQKA